jgi:hypothetical protein
MGTHDCKTSADSFVEAPTISMASLTGHLPDIFKLTINRAVGWCKQVSGSYKVSKVYKKFPEILRMSGD